MKYSQLPNSCQPDESLRVDAWLKRIQRLTWPTTCVLCARAGQPQMDLCSGCEADLVLNDPACRICAQPLTGTSPHAFECGACLQRTPRYDVSHVPFKYAYPLDHLVRALKYHRAVAGGRVLGELMARHIENKCRSELPELLLPVPLATQRYRERGYNQAIELALHVQRRIGIPLCTDMLARTRHTQEQAGLNRKARGKNIRDAFVVVTELAAAHVAIIDDVVTTGSTVNEIAKAQPAP